MKKDKINAIIYGDIVYIEFNEELHVFIPIVGTHGLFMFVIRKNYLNAIHQAST